MSGCKSRQELLGCAEITEYMQMVERPEPEYGVCEAQKKLMKMIRKRFDDEELVVNRTQLEKYLALQKYFPYRLFPWEKFVFALHNCVYRADGLLRWPEVFIFCGRGTGKNGYLSFEDFVLLTPVNGVKNYDIDIGANSEPQARMSFDDVYNIMEDNKRKLGRFFTWNKECITSLQTGSKLQFRTSNAKTADGRRPGKVDFDEMHQYADYSLLDVFTSGLGKKPYPRKTIITTNGYVRDGPLDHYLARAEEILNGTVPDNGMLPCIWRLDDKSEVEDERNWHKANPSLRYFPNLLDEMRREYDDYKRDNIGNAGFMTKRMNLPQSNTESEVTSWENILACSREPKSKPTVWVAGVDFARTTDFVAVTLFGIAGEEWVWQSHSWVCRQCKDLQRIKFPLEDAAERGLITWVDDVEISGEYPARWLQEQMQEKRIIACACDDYRFGIIKTDLENVGFVPGKDGNMQLVKGRNIMQIAPALIAKLARQQLCFGDNPLMRWYINNAKQLLDTRGNVTFGKQEAKSRKTDGFMAGVAAVTLLERLEAEIAMQDMDFEVWTF